MKHTGSFGLSRTRLGWLPAASRCCARPAACARTDAVLGALLTAARLDVARLTSHLEPRHPETAQRLQHLAQTLDRGIALKRRVIEALRPSTLSNLGLEIPAQQFSEQTGVTMERALDAVELDHVQNTPSVRP